MDKDLVIVELLTKLEVRVITLERENRLLREQLVAKNSHNSSRPPSTGIAPPKRTWGLRKVTGRKPGGQPGHAGSNLKMVSSPDVVDKRVPTYCERFGSDLSDTLSEFIGKRQVIDIPPIVPMVTEQPIYARTCTCGHTTCEEYSPNANAPVGYGGNGDAI